MKCPPRENPEIVYSSLMKTAETRNGSRINSDNSDGGLYSVSDVPIYTPDINDAETAPNSNLYASAVSAELTSEDADEAYDHIDSSAAQPILFSDEIDSVVDFSGPVYMVINTECDAKNQSNQGTGR